MTRGDKIGLMLIVATVLALVALSLVAADVFGPPPIRVEPCLRPHPGVCQ